MFDPQHLQVMTVAAERAQNPNMPRLRSVVPETREVIAIATKAHVASSVSADTESKADVLSMLQSSHMVHLACHGIQHTEEPHNSHFCLSTGDLTVSDLTAAG